MQTVLLKNWKTRNKIKTKKVEKLKSMQCGKSETTSSGSDRSN